MWILSSLAFYFAYIFIRVMSFSFNFFMFHDLIVNFVIPLYVLSRATKGNSNPRLKGNRKGIIVKGKEFYIPILNTFPTR